VRRAAVSEDFHRGGEVRAEKDRMYRLGRDCIIPHGAK
jgi:hypothetical protein